MPLERGVCSCDGLKVYSCYRGWREACQATLAISTTSRRELSSSFFFLQGKAPKEIHAILLETLGEHAPSYDTVKNWVAQFKRVFFFTCDAPRPGRPKTVTTPEIIDQIHELILEDGRISAKSIAGQLGISRERIVSIVHEDLDMRKLSAKWVMKCLNLDEKHQWCQLSEQLSEFFRLGAIQLISCRNWWPWTRLGYITIIRKQKNNQWSGDIAAHSAQNNSQCKTPLEKILPWFLGVKTESSSLTVFQLSTHLCWFNWRTFWRKNASAALRSLTGPCSCTTMPGSPSTCIPEETGLPGLPVLHQPLYSPDLARLD